MSSPEYLTVTAVVIPLPIGRLLVVRRPVSVVLIWRNVVVIMMHHVRVAVFVLVVMVVIVMDHIRAITAIDRGDTVLILAPLIVGSCV